MNHTPTPWTHHKAHYTPEWRKDNHIIETAEPQPSKISGFDPTVENVCHMAKPEDAEFIVRAVNSHDELLAALEAVMKCNKELGAISKPIADEARAAIANAKG